MTKQEAIKILRNTAWLGTNEDREKTEQAVEVVTEALEQETVSRETYTHEYCLRKEFEMKVVELEKKIAEQESIIYCKNCKHWQEWENGTGSCHRSDIMWVGSDYDDYCSFAEQKESDEE